VGGRQVLLWSSATFWTIRAELPPIQERAEHDPALAAATSATEGGVPMGAHSDLMETIERAKETMTVRRVFGDPVEKDGVTIVPAARVQGGAGGGGGEGPEGQGSGMGSGFGVNARPVGAFVIKGEDVQWRPAIDVNKVILGAQLVAIAALLLAGAVVRARKAVVLQHA
jgi:uncharacterized spore protein YtfJ